MHQETHLERPSRGEGDRRALRVAVPVVLAGVLVGCVVWVMAASLGIASCAPREALVLFERGPTCEELVRSLSLRTGAVAGVVTSFSLLLSMGLLRTVIRMEEDRHRRAVERYREGRAG